jgi:hypothetical protein
VLSKAADRFEVRSRESTEEGSNEPANIIQILLYWIRINVKELTENASTQSCRCT